MVDASGESKGASLLRASRPTDGSNGKDTELARRFGINATLRSQFRAVISG